MRIERLTWREKRLLRNLRRNFARQSFSEFLSLGWSKLLIQVGTAEFPAYEKAMGLNRRKRESSSSE